MYFLRLCVCTTHAEQYSSINPVKIVFPGRHRRFLLTFIRLRTYLEEANHRIKTHGASWIVETSSSQWVFAPFVRICIYAGCTSMCNKSRALTCHFLMLSSFACEGQQVFSLNCDTEGPKDNTRQCGSVPFSWWDWSSSLEKNQNKTSGHLRHNAPTNGGARFWHIDNV